VDGIECDSYSLNVSAYCDCELCYFVMFQNDIIDRSTPAPPHATIASDSALVIVEQEIVITSSDFMAAVADFLDTLNILEEGIRRNLSRAHSWVLK